jgi:hypothetical protein
MTSFGEIRVIEPGPGRSGREIVVVQEIRAGQTGPGRLNGLVVIRR